MVSFLEIMKPKNLENIYILIYVDLTSNPPSPLVDKRRHSGNPLPPLACLRRIRMPPKVKSLFFNTFFFIYFQIFKLLDRGINRKKMNRYVYLTGKFPI